MTVDIGLPKSQGRLGKARGSAPIVGLASPIYRAGRCLMRTVGRYEILREIGRGGMAVVYAARQPDLDRQVALKELSSFHANSAEFAHRFLRESRLAGSLNHPNIVTVHEYFEHDGTPYIAMELVPRGSLRPYLKGLSLARVGGVLEGILAALAHAEAAGIVHRDLKPENVMVTADGRVKITDFGIARATQRAGTKYVTATGMTVGTPTYMAPEQAMAGEIGPWTDLYSVGVLTYELVVGNPPFSDSDNPVAILMRHVNERIPSPLELQPTLDPSLSHWIDSLLIKRPDKRVRHALTAWESLQEIIVRLHGPLWRRDARLLADPSAAVEADPLTPAPFESHASISTPTPRPAEVAGEFITFDPGPAQPEPDTLPEPELTGNPAVATALGGVIRTLNAARATDGRRLEAARRPADQASAAGRLARVYDSAATAAGRLTPGPVGADANASIVTALDKLGAAYGSLAHAADRNDNRQYAAASTAITQADAALGAGFARLRQDGYTIG